MQCRPHRARTRGLPGVVLGCALALLATACGLAESVVEDFVDDQDYELFASEGSIGTLVRQVDGTDVAVQQGVLRPGDTAADHQALGVLGFGFDRDLQPDKTQLEWIRLRFWFEPGVGDAAALGPLIVSHLPNAESVLGTGLVPVPPGDDVGTITDVTSSGWREVDVSHEFLAAWNANRQLAAFVIRFATPTDDAQDDDDVDLFPEVEGVVRRAHLVLHFGVDL